MGRAKFRRMVYNRRRMITRLLPRHAFLFLPALLLLCSLPTVAHAEAEGNRWGLGGYIRLGARPDFQGGNNRLGYWNLYGRLLNEGPWVALEARLDVLPREPGSGRVWTSIHAKVEGGSVFNADVRKGSLGVFNLTQLYVQAGNVLIPDLTWQLGTMDTYFGDLGLYDSRPAQLFFETMGLSARYQRGALDVLVGVGDSGYFTKGFEYNTILTAGGYVRGRLGKHVELGGGGQFLFEPGTQGNRNAPFITPGVAYEDFVRGEVAREFLLENPGREDFFPRPETTNAQSWKAIAYLGFGGWGALRWNNLFVNVRQLHPETRTVENYQGRDYTIYLKELTDERLALLVGNEMQLRVIPQRLDIAWAAMFGRHWDGDNSITPSDHDRTYYSAVLRTQIYLTDWVHVLAETSAAREISTNGNTYRSRADSPFQSSAGLSDNRGFEWGDMDQRGTWQGKIGFVLNPLGPGIYTRPSLRILYGVQYSTQNNAFGNSFVETLDQFNEFGAVERHWHHVLALEAEAWF